MYGHGDPNQVEITLSGQAEQWPSPVAAEATRGSGTYKRGNPTLKGAALGMGGRRPTKWPTRVEHGSGDVADAEHHRSARRQKADADLWGTKGRPLEVVASNYSLPDPPTPDGLTSLSDSPSSRRRLNPMFVEFLMGWPRGWTACEPVETASSPWMSRMRTALSALCSPPQPIDQGELF